MDKKPECYLAGGSPPAMPPVPPDLLMHSHIPRLTFCSSHNHTTSTAWSMLSLTILCCLAVISFPSSGHLKQFVTACHSIFLITGAIPSVPPLTDISSGSSLNPWGEVVHTGIVSRLPEYSLASSLTTPGQRCCLPLAVTGRATRPGTACLAATAHLARRELM